MRSLFKYPVFFDRSGVRGRAFAQFETCLIIFFIFTFSALLINFSIAPPLPTIKAANSEALAAVQNTGTLSKKYSQRVRNRSFGQAAESLERMAFFANWDVNSSISLKANADLLDVVLPLWLHLGDGAGTMVQDDKVAEQQIRQWIFENAPHLRIMPVIDNYSPDKQQWNSESINLLLSSIDAQERFMKTLQSYIDGSIVHGIVLNFEELSILEARRLIPFVRKLSSKLSASGRKLYVAISANSENIDFQGVAEVADRLIILNYNQHTEKNEPGPLASQGWFEQKLDQFFENIDDKKLIVAIGCYAYDWANSNNAKEISISEAWSLLKKSNSSLYFHGEFLNPTFKYRTGRGEVHEVWLLDAITAFNQAAAALAMKPSGLALWRLGSEDPSVWSIFARGHIPNAETVRRLNQVEPGHMISYQGEGEILRVTALNTAGKRLLEYDPTYNLITEERISVIPMPTTISRWGSQEKVVALTFDDGPSEGYTAKILDTLAKEEVKATFFVIGSNVALLPKLVRRMYAEGHDIGNHTFTHPNIALLSAGQLKLELTATERTLESIINVGSNLFRPPFAVDIEAENVEQAASLIRSADLGYTTVGQSVDPLDWSLPGVDAIVENTIQQLTQGAGNIVLLHDGGGDRSQTLEALPRIIQELKGRGYKFLTVHELLGLSRADIMPRVPPGDSFAQTFTLIGLDIGRVVIWLIQAMFVAGIALGVSRAILVALGALTHAARRKNFGNLIGDPHRFTVIIPAYNEARVICKSVWALLNLPPGNFDIIVVDDGSTDGTADALLSNFSDNPRVRVLCKPYGGKSSALSLGLKQTDTEFIVTQDADTIFAQNALPLLLRHFSDPRVGAVAGAAEVGNQINWLTKFQSIEYITSQNMDRRALELVNAITVVPGAIGAWRRSALLAAGGFTGDTLAEDTDITLRIERAGFLVVCDNDAVGRTEAPESVRAFCKQRYRWMFGTLQAAFKHCLELRHGSGWGMKCVGLPNIVLFQFAFTLVGPVIDLTLLWNIFASIWMYNMHPAAPSPVWNVLPYWIGFQGIEAATLALAFRLDRRRGWWRALPLLLAQRFWYRQLLYWIAGRCLIAALHGHLVGWNKLTRTGRVSVPQSQLSQAPLMGEIDEHRRAVNSSAPTAEELNSSGRVGYDRALIFRHAHALRKHRPPWKRAMSLIGWNSADVKPFGYFLKLAWQEAREMFSVTAKMRG